jgi:dienelactone hydrolase
MISALRVAATTAIMVAAVLAGCASRISIPGSSGGLTLPGDLYRPEGSGPFPAVVLLGHCGGVEPFMADWARWLTNQGYVALLLDSFAPRGATNACQGGPPTVSTAARDAMDALAYLKSSPLVDGERVAVMGWSHGAGAALQASSRTLRPFGVSEALRFRAAVALYPACSNLDVQTPTPTLLLLAGRDDWTPPRQCVSMGEFARGRGSPVSWEMYANAHHSFDRPGARPAFGFTMEYDGSAAAAAHEAVRTFLAAQFSRGTSS